MQLYYSIFLSDSDNKRFWFSWKPLQRSWVFSIVKQFLLTPGWENYLELKFIRSGEMYFSFTIVFQFWAVQGVTFKLGKSFIFIPVQSNPVFLKHERPGQIVYSIVPHKGHSLYISSCGSRLTPTWTEKG